MRHKTKNWKLGKLATGFMLLGAFAAPLGHGPIRVHGAAAHGSATASALLRSLRHRALSQRTKTSRAVSLRGGRVAGAGEKLIAHTSTQPALHKVGLPSWWRGTCDSKDHPGSYALASWEGLTACAPGQNRGGYDLAVDFFPGAWGEYEWECVELSMRWLYLEYGVRPYSANGSGVVDNYSRSNGGDLVKVANDGSGAPRAGDVLSMGSTYAEGHTAVVTGRDVVGGTGTISILEQNMNGGDGTNTLEVLGNVVEPDSGIPVTGWLQGPTQVPVASLASSSHAQGATWLLDKPESDSFLSRLGKFAADGQRNGVSRCVGARGVDSGKSTRFYGSPSPVPIGLGA